MNEVECEVVRWDTVVASYLLASVAASFLRKCPSSDHSLARHAYEHLAVHADTVRVYLEGRGVGVSPCPYVERLSVMLREFKKGHPAQLPPLPAPGMLVHSDVKIK